MDQLQHYSPQPEISYDQKPDDVRLQDIAASMRRRKWIIISVMVLSLGLAVLATAIMHKRWQAEAQMVLIQRLPQQVVTAYAQAGYTAPPVATIDTEMGIIQSRGMAQRTLNWLKNDAVTKGQSAQKAIDDYGLDPLDPEDDLQKNITVTNPKDTNLLNIAARATTPEKARELADAVCQAFVLWDKEMAQQDLQKSVYSLQGRAKQAGKQLNVAERNATTFLQRNRINDVSGQDKAALEQLVQSRVDLANAQQEVQAQQERLAAMKIRLSQMNKAIQGAPVVNDPNLVLALQTQLNQMVAQRASDATRYTKLYPGHLAQDDAQIHNLQIQLKAARLGAAQPSLPDREAAAQDVAQTQVTLRTSQARLAAVKANNLRLQSDAATMPGMRLRYGQLSRQVDLASSLYTNLQSALDAALLDMDRINGNVQITHGAIVPPLPYRPNLMMNLAIGALLGLFLSFMMVWLVEQADRRVYSMETAGRMLSGPVIGAVPQLTRAQTRALLQGKLPPLLVEKYNLAAANLALAVRRSRRGELWQHQLILITSAVRNEGKSLTAAQLARSFARAGKNVVLVDADLRQPSQHTLFPGEVAYGLADVLANNVPLKDALVKSDTPNLSLLHGGSLVGDPTDLITSPRMKAVLDALRHAADMVVVDTPACSIVADALYLAPLADCILQVVGIGRVDEASLQDTTAALEAAAPKTLVSFINYAPRSRGPMPYQYPSSSRRMLGNGHRDNGREITLLPGMGDEVGLGRKTKEITLLPGLSEEEFGQHEHYTPEETVRVSRADGRLKVD